MAITKRFASESFVSQTVNESKTEIEEKMNELATTEELDAVKKKC